jgi:hypothetical protein
MTALSLPLWARLAWPAVPATSQVRAAPPRRPRPQPIFIHDAITPCAGETLLSVMLRCDLERLDGSGND